MSCLHLLKSACSFLELGHRLKSCLLASLGAPGSYWFAEVFLEYFSTHPGVMLLIWLLITLSSLMISSSLLPWWRRQLLPRTLVYTDPSFHCRGRWELRWNLDALFCVTCSFCHTLTSRWVCPFVLFAPGIIKPCFVVFISHMNFGLWPGCDSYKTST